ncbi:MAG: pilus assembly FimT family protein [Acidithiobacillus sp.]
MDRQMGERGFTFIELMVVMVLLGLLAAFAIPRFVDLQKDARMAKVQALAGAVAAASNLVYSKVLVTNNGFYQPGQTSGTTSVAIGQGVTVRVWNGYPDRWWDGIGAALAGGGNVGDGSYLNSGTCHPYQGFCFYGYGNGVLPNGLAGWALQGAPDPGHCSVTYANTGNGQLPVVGVYNGGC